MTKLLSEDELRVKVKAEFLDYATGQVVSGSPIEEHLDQLMQLISEQQRLAVEEAYVAGRRVSNTVARVDELRELLSDAVPVTYKEDSGHGHAIPAGVVISRLDTLEVALQPKTEKEGKS